MKLTAMFRWLAYSAASMAVWGGTSTLILADDRPAGKRAVTQVPHYVRSLAAYNIPNVVLTNQKGDKVALASLLDGEDPVLVNFLFTSCSTTCPLITATVTSMRQMLGASGEDLKVVSITIDPKHDTPKVLQEYALEQGLNPDWQLLTGDASQIRSVLKAFAASSGSIMNHKPLTLLRAEGSSQWVRINGYASAAELAGEYRRINVD
ncbi:MAG: SCO family protein [Burkholderiales bacterium]